MESKKERPVSLLKKMQQPRYQTVSLRPYKMLSTSVHTRLHFLFGALLLQVGMLLATGSWSALTVIASSVLASLIVEASELFVRRRSFYNWLYALTQGMIVGFFIPCTYPAVPVFFITLSILLVSKYMLGNVPNCWVNPVALTAAVCWLIGMNLFPAFSLTPEILQAKNPGALLLQNRAFPLLASDVRLTALLNEKLFRIFNVSVPEGFITLFWDTGASIPAFRFNLLTILSSIVLIAFDVIRPLIPAVFLTVYLLLVRLLAPFFYGGIPGQGDMLLAMLSSGTLFSAIFLFQWTGTTPMTSTGKVWYGILAGLSAFLIVGCGLSSAGIVFVVLVVNIISAVIQALEALYADHCVNAVLLPKSRALEENGTNA